MAKGSEERYIRFYTEGSAARKVEVVRPKKKASLPKTRKQQVYVFPVDPVAMVGIMVAVVLLVTMVSSVLQLQQERQQLQVMTDYLYALESENAVTRAQYESQVDLEQIRERALALGMIPVEEARHITIQVSAPVEEATQEPTLWQELCMFFDGLFA